MNRDHTRTTGAVSVMRVEGAKKQTVHDIRYFDKIEDELARFGDGENAATAVASKLVTQRKDIVSQPPVVE